EHGEPRVRHRAGEPPALREGDEAIVPAPDEQRRLRDALDGLRGGDRSVERAGDGAREARIVLVRELLGEDASPDLAGRKGPVVAAALERPGERDPQQPRPRRRGTRPAERLDGRAEAAGGRGESDRARPGRIRDRELERDLPAERVADDDRFPETELAPEA